jgi:RNA polymerase sigma-70 factor (ECF subfamily)
VPLLDVFHLCRPQASALYSHTSVVRLFFTRQKKEGVNGIKPPLRWFLLVSKPYPGERSDVLDPQDQVRFEMLVLPHLDAAFNLARWLLRSSADAEDAAQEAMLRSYRFFHGFHGGDVRAWLLQIVRNTCYTWLEKNRRVKDMTEFDEEMHGPSSPTPEALAIAGDNRECLTHALESLPPRYREVIVLRELEGCSYKEIATITSIPIGTVMSTLSRARRQLQLALADTARLEVNHEL